MSNWPITPSFVGYGSAMGVNTGTGAGTSVTAGIRSLGSWVELSSSIPEDYDGFYVGLVQGGTGYLEFGIGAAASEETIAQLPSNYGSGRHVNILSHTYVPVKLPQGQRLSVRMSCRTTSTNEVVILSLIHI